MPRPPPGRSPPRPARRSDAACSDTGSAAASTLSRNGNSAAECGGDPATRAWPPGRLRRRRRASAPRRAEQHRGVARVGAHPHLGLRVRRPAGRTDQLGDRGPGTPGVRPDPVAHQFHGPRPRILRRAAVVPGHVLDRSGPGGRRRRPCRAETGRGVERRQLPGRDAQVDGGVVEPQRQSQRSGHPAGQHAIRSGRPTRRVWSPARSAAGPRAAVAPSSSRRSSSGMSSASTKPGATLPPARRAARGPIARLHAGRRAPGPAARLTASSPGTGRRTGRPGAARPATNWGGARHLAPDNDRRRRPTEQCRGSPHRTRPRAIPTGSEPTSNGIVPPEPLRERERGIGEALRGRTAGERLGVQRSGDRIEVDRGQQAGRRRHPQQQGHPAGAGEQLAAPIAGLITAPPAASATGPTAAARTTRPAPRCPAGTPPRPRRPSSGSPASTTTRSSAPTQAGSVTESAPAGPWPAPAAPSRPGQRGELRRCPGRRSGRPPGPHAADPPEGRRLFGDGSAPARRRRPGPAAHSPGRAGRPRPGHRERRSRARTVTAASPRCHGVAPAGRRRAAPGPPVASSSSSTGMPSLTG